MNPGNSALLTDLYQLTMLQAYFEEEMQGTAVFEFFVRRLPADRCFLMAAGLEQVLEYLEGLRFSAAELSYLQSTRQFRGEFLEYLGRLRFQGEVAAMEEGMVFFGNEPILQVTAEIGEAQLVETRIINLLQFQTMVASKAARCVLAAGGKRLVDFGCRRAHGAEAALLSSRATCLAGFQATSNVLAGKEFGLAVSGTMAHSYVQAHEREEEAFERFALANPGNVVFLLDTYDTEAAAEKAAVLAKRLEAEGITVQGVRLDSGDLGEHAKRVRGILDGAGLHGVKIFASGNLDEFALERLADSPIDGFGVGTRVDTSADAPYLECAYKLEEYEGKPRMKRSEGKSTWPGKKQVFRRYDGRGELLHDVVGLADERVAGRPLLVPVMRDGRRIAARKAFPDLRADAEAELARLPEALRALQGNGNYEVKKSKGLRGLMGE